MENNHYYAELQRQSKSCDFIRYPETEIINIRPINLSPKSKKCGFNPRKRKCILIYKTKKFKVSKIWLFLYQKDIVFSSINLRTCISLNAFNSFV